MRLDPLSRGLLLLLASCEPACGGTGRASTPAGMPSSLVAGAARSESATGGVLPVGGVNFAGAPNNPREPTDACGPLDCRRFATPEAAFTRVLSLEPEVLAVGESHAQRGTESIDSSTKRFTEQLLPLLQGKASDLVVEIWAPDPRCLQRAADVAEKQQPVTETQAKTAKSEFVLLAEAARRIGIVPWPLRPTCEEYERVARAGEDAVEQLLVMTRDLTLRTIQARLAHNQHQGDRRIVVAYVGAMHNDLQPRPGRERYSYGPELSRLTSERYVELDVFVPEFIQDAEVWRSLVWYPYFDRSQRQEKTTLFRPTPASFVLLFPSSAVGRSEQAPVQSR
jgi:hypothetical protein